MTHTNLEVFHDVAVQPLESQSRFFGFVFVCVFCFGCFVSCGPPNLQRRPTLDEEGAIPTAHTFCEPYGPYESKI